MTPGPSPAALAAIEFAAVLDVIAEHASGPLGAAAIRQLTPSTDQFAINAELRLVGELLTLMERGDRPDVPPVPDIRAAIGRLKVPGSVLDLGEMAEIRLSLAAGRLIADELHRLREITPAVHNLRREPIDRAIERQLERSIGEDGELLDTASPGLAAARREVHAARERLIRRLEVMLRDIDGGGGVTIREGRYVIPIRRDARSRPDGIIHDESSSAGTLFVEPAAAIPLGNALRAAVSAEQREVLAVLRDLSELLRPVAPEIAELHRMSVMVDSLRARAAWAHRVGGTVPKVIASGGEIRLDDARHPLLLARGIAAVPFTLVMEESERTLLISGPNTGGKTVLLKATALMAMLAQSGVVPSVGAGSVIPVIERLFVDIGDHQSLQADLSTFSGHVAVIREILAAADSRTLVVMDEVGSGTDPAEGGALAMAVLESLTSRGTLTLATTHLGALKSLAGRVPGVVNGSLEFDSVTLAPTYRFTKGIPGRSFGLAIARRLGVDSQVLDLAESLVPEAERDLEKLLAAVEARGQKLAALEQELADRFTEVDGREANAAAREENLAARETEWRRREKEAEQERARQAKAYLLAARQKVEEALGKARGAVDEAAARDARRLVEDAVSAESRVINEDSAIPEAADPSRIEVDAPVRLSTGATGRVVELRSDGRAVVTVGAMRLVVKTASLVRLASAPAKRKPEPKGDEVQRDASREIDLRGMRVDDARLEVLAALDGAVLAELPELRIIHGMGTGAVREAVRQLLSQDSRVANFDFAPRQQGGTGVTIAVLR